MRLALALFGALLTLSVAAQKLSPYDPGELRDVERIHEKHFKAAISSWFSGNLAEKVWVAPSNEISADSLSHFWQLYAADGKGINGAHAFNFDHVYALLPLAQRVRFMDRSFTNYHVLVSQSFEKAGIRQTLFITYRPEKGGNWVISGILGLPFSPANQLNFPLDGVDSVRTNSGRFLPHPKEMDFTDSTEGDYQFIHRRKNKTAAHYSIISTDWKANDSKKVIDLLAAKIEGFKHSEIVCWYEGDVLRAYSSFIGEKDVLQHISLGFFAGKKASPLLVLVSEDRSYQTLRVGFENCIRRFKRAE